MKRSLAACAALVVALAGCSNGGDTQQSVSTTTAAPAASSAGPTFPGEEWEVVDPADQGIDPAGLEAARTYAFAPELNTQGVVVVHRGKIVAEWYAEGADASSWAASWSVAKSFASATVGIAIDEGHIPSVDEPAATYLDSWADTEHAAITVEHLLHMASGLDWTEDYRGSDAEIVRMVVAEPDQLAYAMSTPVAVEPGTRWSYSSGDTMLLAGIVEAATGKPLHEYAAEQLLEPIGIGRAEWWRDAAGNTLGYCCLDSTSRDFARLGLLYLHRGSWDGEQVISSEWVDASIEPVEVSGGDYGYQWWTYDIEGVPDDAFLAEGIDGQFIYVVPSHDLVVVRNGTYVKDPGPPVADPNLFARYPSGSLVEGRGTAEPDGWDSSQFLAPIVAAIGR